MKKCKKKWRKERKTYQIHLIFTALRVINTLHLLTHLIKYSTNYTSLHRNHMQKHVRRVGSNNDRGGLKYIHNQRVNKCSLTIIDTKGAKNLIKTLQNISDLSKLIVRRCPIRTWFWRNWEDLNARKHKIDTKNQ